MMMKNGTKTKACEKSSDNWLTMDISADLGTFETAFSFSPNLHHHRQHQHQLKIHQLHLQQSNILPLVVVVQYILLLMELLG
jgi:hypothetical protein